MNWKRTFSPKTNPALYSALAGLAYAIWQAELAATATGPLTWQRVSHIAAGVAWAFASRWIRSLVTPVADPRDGNGKPMIPSSAELKVTTVTGSTQVDLAEQIADTIERRRAENQRLMNAPGTPSFYPYPGEADAPSATGSKQ